MKLPQLSLRDLFWLVLVCAVGLGWWLDRNQLSAQIATYQVELESEYLRGESDEDARWTEVIENRAGLDDATKLRIRREYLKLPGSGLPRLNR